MKIVELRAKNVKRLKAVEIKPDGNVVVVSGRNSQGKSSLLDSIVYALTGKKGVCATPVRRGEQKAEIICDLGDLLVRRTFTAEGGMTLTVQSAEGAKFSSPQAVLDALTGRLSFDPLEFARQDPKRQAETLRALVGLDTSAIDAERARLFDDRTVVNREAKSIKSRLDAAKHFPDAPASEVSVQDILKELDAVRARNTQRTSIRAKATTAEQDFKRAEVVYQDILRDISTTESEIARLTQRLNEQRDEAAKRKGRIEDTLATWTAAKANAAKTKDEPTDHLQRQIATVEDTNRAVRANAERAKLAQEHEAKTAESVLLTRRLEDLDKSRADAIAAAKFPVAGLGFDEHGVTLNGLPFDQASAAEQLKVSVAMGLAANPKLRVILIRDGSLLDQESLQLIGEMAVANDAQVWIERVEQDGDVSVVIEDGSVVATKEVALATN